MDRKRTVGMVAIAALALTSCQGSSPEPQRSAGAVPPTAAASPTWNLDTPPVVVGTVEMSDFGERPNYGSDGVFAVGADYIVRPDPDSPHGRTTVVTRRADGTVVLRHTPQGTDFATDFVGLDGDFLVLVDEDVVKTEPAKEHARATVYDLRTGVATPVSRIPGAPPLSLYGPQATVADGIYYYSASVDGGFSNCVGAVDLAKLRGWVVECGKPGEWILYVSTASHGASWVHFHGYGYEVCREGRQIQNGVLGPVGPPDDCGTFDTAAHGLWQIWGSFPPGPIQPSTTLRATDGSRTVELGAERQMTLRVCGAHVYWSDMDYERIFRWRPGAGVVEQIYQVTGDVENTWVHPRGCADGILTITVRRYDPSNGSDTMRLLALPG